MKKLLATILALVMALSLCTSAWATEVAVSDEDGLIAAISNANSGVTIKLGANITLKEKLVIGENKTFTLALGEYSITQTKESVNAINLSAGDKVTITGTGTITGKNNGIYVPSGAALTVDGGTIVAVAYNGIYNEGTVLVNGGTLTGGSKYNEEDGETYYYNGIYTKGSVTVSGGTVNAIYIDNGSVTVNGGTIDKNSDGDSFPDDSGTLNVTNGEVKGWMSPALSTTISGGTFGDSVFADQVTGGTFNKLLTMNGENPSVSGATINAGFSWWSSTVPTIGEGVKFSETATLDQKVGSKTEGYSFNSTRDNIVAPVSFVVTAPDAAQGSYELTYKLNNTTKATRTSKSVDNQKVPVGSTLEIDVTATAKQDYKFDGWYLNGEKMTESVDDNGRLNVTLTVTENTTLEAKFVSRELETKAAAFFEGYSSKTEFTISDIEQMEYFAYAVTNLGYDFSGKTVKLAADLDFTGKTFRVVGDKTHVFKGAFDAKSQTGENHTIKGISVKANGGYVALFANLSGATVQNLNLENCSFDASTSGYAGGIAAEAGGNTIIKNCNIKDVATSGWFSGSVVGHTFGGVTVESVTVTGCTASGAKGGAVVGYSDSITIKDVTVSDVKAGAALIGHANAGDNVIEDVTVNAPNAPLINTTYSESKGSVTIKGENTEIKAKNIVGETVPEAKTVTVENGSYALDNVVGDEKEGQKSSLTISGGTFKSSGGGKLDVTQYVESGKHQDGSGTVGNKTTGGGYYYYPSTPSISAVLNGSNKFATDYTSGNYGLVFRGTASCSSFTGVQVDGKTLAKSNYTVEQNGSGVEVYLKAAYLKTLKDGKHTVTILSTAGNATMDFTIGGKSSSPKTFDAGIGIYAVTAVLSVTGMAWTAKKRH